MISCRLKPGVLTLPNGDNKMDLKERLYYQEIEMSYPEIKELIRVNKSFVNIIKDEGIAVSVVVPIYNAERYLEETLNCIINQTLQNIEVILVNDGSTDGSQSIINKFVEQDSRFDVVIQSNQGGGAARNAGLKLAHGEYIIFLDADDIFDREMLEYAYKYAKSNGADIVFWRFASLDAYGVITHSTKKNIRENTNIANDNILYHQYTNPAPWNKLFKLSFIKKYNILFQPISSCNDIGFVVSAFYLAKSIFYLDKELITYRRGTGVISEKRYQKSENIIKAGQYIINYMDLYKENSEIIYRAIITSFIYEYKQFPKSDQENSDIFLSKVYKFLPIKYHKEFNNRLYKISVIVCIHNITEKQVKNCINSIVSQTLSDIEIICICSNYIVNDNISSLFSGYGVKYIQHSVGKNLSKILGLQYAKGEFIIFNECIELKDSEYLENIYKTLKQSKNTERFYEIKKVNGDYSHTVYVEDIQCDDTVFPNVSIIVPTYNCESFLDKCIKSLLNQTMANIEILCINDGSTDNSLQKIKEYAQLDKRFRFISHFNMGQGASRNIVLSIAKGKYIIFVDSDDWINLDTVEELYMFAEKNRIDMLSYSGVNVENDIFIENPYWEYRHIPEKLYNTNKSQDKLFTRENLAQYAHCLPTSCCLTMYNYQFIQKNNIKFAERLRFEDNYFFTKALCKCERYAIYKKHFYNRLIRAEQTTQQFDRTIFDYFQIFEMCIQEYLKSSLPHTEEQKMTYINTRIDRLIQLREQVLPEIQNEYDQHFVSFLKKVEFKKLNNLVRYLLKRLTFFLNNSQGTPG